jgi:hypothetical protein
MGLVMTRSIDIQHNNTECHCDEYRDYLNVMLSVVRLNVVILSVVAPISHSSMLQFVSWRNKLVRLTWPNTCMRYRSLPLSIATSA